MIARFTASKCILALAFCLFTSAAVAEETAGLEQLTAAETPLVEGEKIAFFGDSITMQGGHIEAIRKALQTSEHTKDLGITLIKHGLNGGRVPTVLEGKSPWGDLGGTMEALLEKEKPTIVVIQLGVNDVWHGEKGTSKADYEAGLKQMVAMSKQAGATVILCTPSVIGEETKDNKLTEQLGEYAEIVRKLAADQKVALCDVHTAFVAELKRLNQANKHSGHLTYDGVHMNKAGNAVLADQVSRAIVAVRAAR